MQSRFWVDKVKPLKVFFSKNHVFVFVQKSRWPYSMQNKFGMDNIQESHKLEWLYMYVLFLLRIYFTSSKKVTDYLYVKGIGCIFKQKNILWMKTNHYPNKITFHLVTVVPMTSFTLKSTSKLRSFCTLDIR